MNITGAIKKVVSELVGAKRNFDSEIEKLRQRRIELQTLPLPRADAIAALQEGVDTRTARWVESFALTIKPMRERFDEHPQMMLLESNGSYVESNRIFPDALYALLAPSIKETISSEIGRMKWPDLVGPPRAERARELAKVNTRIAELEADLKTIREESRSAGIDLNAFDREHDARLFSGGVPKSPVAIDKVHMRG